MFFCRYVRKVITFSPPHPQHSQFFSYSVGVVDYGTLLYVYVRSFRISLCPTILIRFVPVSNVLSLIIHRNDDLIYDSIISVGDGGVVDKAKQEEAEAKIVEIANGWKLQFAGISDLNSYGGAYCGLWWDPNSNWIVIAFKVSV